ncbi:hypothetical protein [Flavobacterium phage FL-1]|nr:hypothetical protein [Flavobacterium phage FL-1]
MNKIEIEFQPTANDKTNVLHSQLQKSIAEKCIAFRESVCHEIIRVTKGKPSGIQFIRHIDWDSTYSQVFHDGVFMGHLHEDFINCKFTFNPA